MMAKRLTLEERQAELDSKSRDLLTERAVAVAFHQTRAIKAIDEALSQLDREYGDLANYRDALPDDDLPSADDPGVGAGNGAWRSVILMVIALVSATLTVVAVL